MSPRRRPLHTQDDDDDYNDAFRDRIHEASSLTKLMLICLTFVRPGYRMSFVFFPIERIQFNARVPFLGIEICRCIKKEVLSFLPHSRVHPSLFFVSSHDDDDWATVKLGSFGEDDNCDERKTTAEKTVADDKGDLLAFSLHLLPSRRTRAIQFLHPFLTSFPSEQNQPPMHD